MIYDTNINAALFDTRILFRSRDMVMTLNHIMHNLY